MRSPTESSREVREAAEKMAIKKSVHSHQWTDWKEVGRTGDWFHPLIVERKCLTCGAAETDER